MFNTGLQEFIIIVAIILVLSATGVWPSIMRALRELRGESSAEATPPIRQDDAELSYRLLGVPASATWDEIEKAYRRKAKIHHPDLGGDPDAMRALNEAYQLLKKTRAR